MSFICLVFRPGWLLSLLVPFAVFSCNDVPIEQKRQPVAAGYDDLMDPWDAPDVSLPPADVMSVAGQQEVKLREEKAPLPAVSASPLPAQVPVLAPVAAPHRSEAIREGKQ